MAHFLVNYPFLWHRAYPSSAPWAPNANSSHLARGMQSVPPIPQLLHCKERDVDNDLSRMYLRSFLYVFQYSLKPCSYFSGSDLRYRVDFAYKLPVLYSLCCPNTVFTQLLHLCFFNWLLVSHLKLWGLWCPLVGHLSSSHACTPLRGILCPHLQGLCCPTRLCFSTLHHYVRIMNTSFYAELLLVTTIFVKTLLYNTDISKIKRRLLEKLLLQQIQA